MRTGAQHQYGERGSGHQPEYRTVVWLGVSHARSLWFRFGGQSEL